MVRILLLEQEDPYHAVIGASDCGDTWMFFDNALTCPNKNGTEPQFPWGACGKSHTHALTLSICLSFFVSFVFCFFF